MKKFFIFIITLLAETLASLLLVMFFFGIFLVILDMQFPSGTVFGSIVLRESSLTTDAEKAQERTLKLSRGNKEAGIGDSSSLAASLTKKHNTVKSKRASSIAWRNAREGMSLYDHDAIQTNKQSSARIEFDKESFIDMRENSLIIIRELKEDLLNNEKRSFLVVADGEFRGRFISSKENPVYIELETPNAVARIKTTSSKTGAVDFKVKVNPDETSTFVVFDGTAEIEAQGKKVELTANQTTSIGINSAPAAPRNLPKQVKLNAPEERGTFTYRKLTPKITFSWDNLPDTAGYYFMVASDPSFYKILIEERVFTNSFTLGNLKAGDYFWRVCSLAGKNADVYSNTRAIKVSQDTSPPILAIVFPDAVVNLPTAPLYGKTDPDTKIYIDGNQINVEADGSFSYDLELKTGVNSIVVEAVDPVGNITYKTKRITRKL
jgi:mannose-6-phosphate isomerase-like protein (cupin superfamily)